VDGDLVLRRVRDSLHARREAQTPAPE